MLPDGPAPPDSSNHLSGSGDAKCDTVTECGWEKASGRAAAGGDITLPRAPAACAVPALPGQRGEGAETKW